MADEGRSGTSALRRADLSLGCFLLFLAVAMFLPAGIGWTEGWVFLLVFLLQMAMASLYLWRKNPDIFVARSKIHAGTKGWDKVVLVFLLLSFLAIYPLAGLDSRYHWSSVPPWLIVLGYVLLSLGMIGSVWAYRVNKFAEPGVRIQTERGHKVIDTGPYAIVRHPIYVAGFLIVAGTPLALGSLWALIPVAVASPTLIVRTAFEDRLLQDELGGYKEYASRVRYKLVPWVW
jgi:protein-S-isoprenylcysteine O-methyltransferase Ste14